MKKILAIFMVLALIFALAVSAYAAEATPADPVAQEAGAFKAQLLNMAKELLALMVTAVFGYVGLYIKKLCKKYVDTAEKKAVVRDGVYFVEQVFKDIHGREKLEQAFAQITLVLNEKGIPIGENELWTMTEAAVHEMNRTGITEVIATE